MSLYQVLSYSNQVTETENFGEYVNKYLTTSADMTKAIMGKEHSSKS